MKEDAKSGELKPASPPRPGTEPVGGITPNPDPKANENLRGQELHEPEGINSEITDGEDG